MENKVDTRRVLIFLAFAFGISWVIGLIVYLTGGIANSPALFKIGAASVTLATVLIATGYMFAPAISHVLTRALTREGWQGSFLKPKFKHGWKYWVIAWVLPGLLTVVGAALYFVIFPRYFDASSADYRAALSAQLGPQVVASLPDPLWPIMIAGALQGILTAPLINGLFTFGEEFGWRAYLQPKLMPLGGRKAMLLIGIIWGVWHWPVIAMGHNYGLNYPGAPWLGILAMVWFTFNLAVILGWLTLKAGSVWPAVIGHAAINGIAGVAAPFISGQPNPLLGPLPVGVIALIPTTLLVAYLFLQPTALTPGEEAATIDTPVIIQEGSTA